MTPRGRRVFSVDPAEPTMPADVPGPEEGRGEVVALLSDAEAREMGWAGPLAIDLAETWGSGEADVILADGDLTGSLLHERIGTTNVEGVSDVVCYGASTERVARPVGSRSFRFVPPGTIVADPAEVYAAPRWSDWFSRIRASGTVLVLCLPAEIGGASELAEHADRVIRFSSSDAEDGGDDSAVVIRADMASRDPSTDAAPDASTPEASGGTADDRLVSGGVGKPESTSKPRESRFGSMLLLALLIVILLLIIAAWLGLISIPGLTASASSG